MDLSPTFAVHFGNRLRLIYRGMEQLVARRAHNPKVASSSLAPATKTIKRLYYYSVTVFDLYSNLGVIEVVLKQLF